MFGAITIVFLVVLVYKVRDLRKDPGNVFLRSYCATIILVGCSFIIGLPQVQSHLEQATGVLSIWYTGDVVIGCAALQTSLLLWTYPPEGAWRKIRPRWLIYGLSLAAIVALDLAGRVDPSTVDIAAYAETPELLWGRTPWVADAMFIYVAALTFTIIEATGIFWRCANVVDRRWLRRGLRILAIGSVINAASCIALAITLAGLQFGTTIAPRAVAAIGSVAILITAIGTTMPAWGPRADRLIAYHRLHPLWRVLYRAFPDVALDPPIFVRVDRWNPWNVNYRLFRRVIEIHDSRRGLRLYLDRDVAARVQQLAQQAGLEGVEMQATVEAAMLAAAIRAKANGRPAADQPALTGATPRVNDLAAALAWLTEVAKAFATSPVVAAVATWPVPPVEVPSQTAAP
jgi:hypothetical protein